MSTHIPTIHSYSLKSNIKEWWEETGKLRFASEIFQREVKERLDTHTRVQCNKVFTNIWMESPRLNYNPIIKKQSNYMVGSADQKGILEMWFKKTD